MPNYVKCNIRIIGTKERIAEFKEFVTGKTEDEKERLFDFNKIIPEDVNNPKYQNGKENYCETTFNWYDWRRKYWGTKWNSMDVEEEVSEDGTTYDMYFKTAWSFPFPIFIKLAEKFQDLEINGEYADEDFGYNCGEIHCKDGGFDCNNDKTGMFKTEKESFEFACNVWGYDASDFYEEGVPFF